VGKFLKHVEQSLKNEEYKTAFEDQTRLMRIGRLIRSSRQLKNLSQEKLSALTGISQADVSRIEAGHGKKGPSVDTLVRILNAGGLRLELRVVPKNPSKLSDEMRAQLALLKETF
jgi:transcriptional regulator with XRE-family HTH domain